MVGSLITLTAVACMRNAQTCSPIAMPIQLQLNVLHRPSSLTKRCLAQKLPSLLAPNISRPLAVVPRRRVVDPTDHHFLPRLISPGNRNCGIGVVWILHRVIVNRAAVDLGSFGHEQWLLLTIDTLPIEVITRDGKKRLFLAIGISN